MVFLVGAAGLAVVTAGIRAVFSHDLATARARLTGRSRTIETSLGTLECAVVGDGQPLLIVHGAGGGFDQGIDMAGAMAELGYRLIVPSRFGYLRSTLPTDPTTAMQGDAYADLLDRLGIDRVVAVAISAGAWSSLQFAIRHPQRCRALVLVVPADYLPPGRRVHGGALADAMFKSDFVAWSTWKLLPIVPGLLAQTLLGTDAAVLRNAGARDKARIGQIFEHLLPVSARANGMRFDIQTAAAHELYPLEKITCPVLAISAEDDRFGTAARARFIAAGVPCGNTITFPTGGHALVGHDDDVLRAIINALTALDRRDR